jgi:hypothetical protein
MCHKQVSGHKAATVNQVSVFLDIPNVRNPDEVVKATMMPNWRIMVEEHTQLKFSKFLPNQEWNGQTYLRAIPELERHWKGVEVPSNR